MYVTVEIDSNAREVLSRVRSMPKEMTSRVREAVNLTNQETIRVVTVDVISFPANGPVQRFGLRRQTATLARSLRATPAKVSGELDVETSIGTNIGYGLTQEEGFQGTVNVRAYTRRTFTYRERQVDYLNPVTKKRELIMKVTRRNTGNDVVVRAHTMQMNLPARHWLSRPIQERAPVYGRAISQAVVNVWNEDAIESGGKLPFIGSYST